MVWLRNSWTLRQQHWKNIKAHRSQGNIGQGPKADRNPTKCHHLVNKAGADLPWVFVTAKVSFFITTLVVKPRVLELVCVWERPHLLKCLHSLGWFFDDHCIQLYYSHLALRMSTNRFPGISGNLMSESWWLELSWGGVYTRFIPVKTTGETEKWIGFRTEIMKKLWVLISLLCHDS